MAAPPYQKLFWGSYHKHTAHLMHAREHGAYLLLIGALWNNEGRLPADDETLAAYAKLSAKEWAAVKPKLMPLFRVVRGKLTQPRVTEDLAKYRDTSGKRKAAGKSGGEARSRNYSENRQAIATVLPTKPEPEPEEERAKALFVASDEPTATGRGKEPWDRDQEFGRLWDAAPPLMRKRAKSKAKTWPEWQRATKRALPTAIVAGLIRYKALDADLPRSGGPGLHIWLRDRTWEQWTGDGSDTGAMGGDWTEGRWRAAVGLWRNEGAWDDRLGPKPGEPGCRVSPAIQREYGVEPAGPVAVRAAG